MAALLLAPVASSFVGFFGKGVTRAGSSVMKAGIGYNNMDHMDKKL